VPKSSVVQTTFVPSRKAESRLPLGGTSHLRGEFDAQWNDDIHHVLHVLLTGERGGYYEDFAQDTAAKLARALSEGFVYQGEPSLHRDGGGRGSPSADLPPYAFVSFLQNHDQIGNRAFGERLTRLANPRALEAAIALQLLAPQIPLIFMGEETASETPFFFFTDHDGALADAVREGRRREFAKFPAFADPARRETIPDPNDIGTFERSVAYPAGERGETRGDLYRRLLGLRAAEIVPRLSGSRSVGASAVGPAAVVACWRLGDGALLTLACNLGEREAPLAGHTFGQLLSQSADVAKHALAGVLAPYATVAFLEIPALARSAGIAVEWVNAAKVPQQVPDTNLVRILGAIGFPCETASQLAESRERIAAINKWSAQASFVTTDAGQPIRIAADEDASIGLLELENGETRDVHLVAPVIENDGNF
jgi:hypothetical protein